MAQENRVTKDLECMRQCAACLCEGKGDCTRPDAAKIDVWQHMPERRDPTEVPMPCPFQVPRS